MEGFNLFPDLIKVSNNFNLIRFFILGWRWYCGTFPAGYNATLGLLSLFKNNYLGHFSSHLKSPRADYLAPEGLDGHFIKGRIFNLGGRRDGRIDTFINVIRAVNCIRIYYGLLRINHRPWSVVFFV